MNRSAPREGSWTLSRPRPHPFCSVPVSFGAVGTPVWFGFSQLGLTDDQLVRIGSRAAVLSLIPAHIVPLLALRLVVPWAEIRRHLLFVVLCIWASVLPFLAFSFVSSEFPSLIGGFVGLLLAGLLARFNVGVPRKEAAEGAPDLEGGTCAEEEAEGGGEAAAHGEDARDAGDGQRERGGGNSAATSGAGVDEQGVELGEVGRAGADDAAVDSSTDGEPARDRGNENGSAEWDGAETSPVETGADASAGSSGHETGGKRPAEAGPGTDNPDGEHAPTPARGDEVKEGERDDGRSAGGDAATKEHPSGGAVASPPALSSPRATEGADRGQSRPLPSAGWALAPIASVVLLLLVTRVIAPVRQWLGDSEPGFTVHLRSLGDVSISSSLVIAWENVLRSGRTLADGTETEAASADYKALLTPAFMPFIVVGAATVLAFRQPLGFRCWARRCCGEEKSRRAPAAHGPARSPRSPTGSSRSLAASPRTVEATERHEPPSPRRPSGDQSLRDCLLGAWHRVFPHAVVGLLFSLVFVRLLLSGGARAPATLLGEFLSDVFGSWFGLVAPLLGALGSFFSGSATVSNLTFGGIQRTAAQAGGLDTIWILALQTAGSAFGNQVCIGNILAVASILGLLDDAGPNAPGSDVAKSPEGSILRMTAIPCCASLLALAIQGVIVA